jgi:hypothetical protein
VAWILGTGAAGVNEVDFCVACGWEAGVDRGVCVPRGFGPGVAGALAGFRKGVKELIATGLSPFDGHTKERVAVSFRDNRSGRV